MKRFFAVPMLFALMAVAPASADVQTDVASLEQAEVYEFSSDEFAASEEATEMDSFFSFSNPPGSQWVTLRCGTMGFGRKFCPAPAGYKIRNVSRGSVPNSCDSRRGRRGWEWSKDGVTVRNRCSLRVRAYVIPAQYCQGNYRYCN